LLIPTRRVTAIKLRKKLPLLLERAGVRRIKIRQKALFDPLILAFSQREKGLSILNLMAVTRRVGMQWRRATPRDSPSGLPRGSWKPEKRDEYKKFF
jgi:hypothetical protein